MQRTEAIAALKRVEPQARATGIAALFLFGSTARDEATAKSDIDVFVDLVPGSVPGFGFIGLKREIERVVGVPCDLTTRTALHPVTAADIQSEAIRIF